MKKKNFKKGKERVLEGTDALMYVRGGYWQIRIYLTEEGKYLRRSTGESSWAIAKERGYEIWREVERDRAVGKRQYGLTVNEGVDAYLESRKSEVTTVEQGGITAERLSVIGGQLKNFRRYMDANNSGKKLSDLKARDCWNYFSWRRETAKREPATSTLMNEKAMINACIRYLYKQRECAIAEFEWPKLTNVGKDETEKRTYSASEYKALYTASRKHIAGKGELIDDKERMLRTLVHNWILIAGNTGMRVGEQKQLRWENVETYKKGGDLLVRVRIDPYTSKVRNERVFIAYGGEYFERLRTMTGGMGYVFSEDDGETHISMRRFRRCWHEVMNTANIPDQRKQVLEPYGLRHYFMKTRYDAGVKLATLAQMCGTSVLEITKTYVWWFESEQEEMALLGRRRKEEE